MPLITQFDPPGNINDLDGISNGRNAWSETISFWTDDTISKRVERLVGIGLSQYVNPLKKDLAAPSATKEVTWLAFPLVLVAKHSGDKKLARLDADRKPATGSARLHDEYCEWHVTIQNNKIVRVDFTCEGPEYWETLAHGYPESVPLNSRHFDALGNKNLVLALYQRFVSSNVQLPDLFPNGKYDPLNKWNTSHGAMHLTHSANSLQAEIALGADATVRRQRSGIEITDAKQLICCAKYGGAQRASDPTIGSDVNALARQDRFITLLNPVALYIKDLDTQGWTTPDGTNAKNFWKIVRGTPGNGLRAVFEVPPDKAYTVSDIKIGGVPIQFGGQIAERITMKLTGIASAPNVIHNKARSCAGGDPLPGCPTVPKGLAATETLDDEIPPSPRLAN
jgi:hypothetical protein